MGQIIPNFQPRSDDEIRAENERLAKIKIRGETPAFVKPTPQQHVATLKAQVAKFKTYPVPDSYTMPVVVQTQKPHCERCNGVGVIRYDVPPEHRLYKKDIPCDVPGGCPVVAYHREARKNSRVEIEVRHFGTDIEYVERASMSHYADDDNRGAVLAARVFLEYGQVVHHDVTKNSLVFFGQVGRGKTYLASAMRNAIERRGESSQYRKIRTLLKAVQRGYGKESELTDYEVENILSNTPYLFIDEFETGFSSGDRTDIFEAIIDHRYRENLPTIITTNLEMNHTRDVWNDRIASRVIHMAHWIEMAGSTRRDTSQPIRGK